MASRFDLKSMALNENPATMMAMPRAIFHVMGSLRMAAAKHMAIIGLMKKAWDAWEAPFVSIARMKHKYPKPVTTTPE